MWFVAREEEESMGFLPIKIRDGKGIINNYYIADDDTMVYSCLLREAVGFLQSQKNEIEAIVQIRHISFFKKENFTVYHYWKRFAKMRYTPENE